VYQDAWYGAEAWARGSSRWLPKASCAGAPRKAMAVRILWKRASFWWRRSQGSRYWRSSIRCFRPT